MNITILSIDDHALFRRCMVDYLDALDDFTVIGEAASPEQGYELALSLKPEIILVDLDLGGRDGMNLAERILNKNSKSIVVILTACTEEKQMVRAMQIGAKAYLSKDIAPDEMVTKLRKIQRGEMVYPVDFLLKQTKNSISSGLKKNRREDDLTPRETEVLQWASDGKTDKAIAHLLSVSEHTIKNHMKNIRKKLDTNNRMQASIKAMELGIIKR